MRRAAAVLMLLALLVLAGAPGRAATPQLVADLASEQEPEGYGLWQGFHTAPAVAAGRTFFFHNDGIHGSELWSTDGSAGGTTMVADICPGACSSTPSFGPIVLLGLPSRVYFQADDGLSGLELWESDGTAAGTRLVADIVAAPLVGSYPTWLTELAGRVLFVAETGGSTCSLFALTIGDDQPEDIASFVCENDDRPSAFTRLGDRLLFSALTPSLGRELWITDGTKLGTFMVVDIAPGAANGLAAGYELWPETHWLAVGGRVLFPADDGVHGVELWQSDGSAAGTGMVVDLEVGAEPSYPQDFTILGDDLLFVARPAATGAEIWRLPLAGPPLPQPLEIAAGSQSSWPDLLGTTSAGAFYAAYRDDVGLELFLTDGSTAGTRLVADLAASDNGLLFGQSRLSSFVEADELLFVGYDDRGVELWRSDGTAAGTSIVADLNPGAGSFFPGDWIFAVATPGPLPDGRHLLFGSVPAVGREPWATDGAGGISLLADVDQQTSIVSCFPRICSPLVGDGSRLAFPAFGWPPGRQSIGWVEGSDRAAVVAPTSLGGDWILRWQGYNRGLAAWAGGKLYFPAGVGFSQDETWVSDGTVAGTRRLYELAPSIPRRGAVGASSRFGRVYLAFYEYLPNGGGERYSLWSTDSTGAGTTQVGPYSIAVRDSRSPVDSFLLFSPSASSTVLAQIDDPASPPLALTTLPGELWSWEVVAEIPRGPGGERLVLLVETPTYWPQEEQRRLWSWGAAAGLVLLADSFVPLAGDWDFEAYLLRPPVERIGNRVFFVGGDAEHGAELWITDGTAAGTGLVADVFPGPLGSHPRWFTAAGEHLYFSAFEPIGGREVWRSDGRGAELSLDVVPGSASSLPSDLTAVDGKVYFAANVPGMGVELVVHQASQALAAEITVHDLFPGPLPSSPFGLTLMSGQLYFFANDGAHGVELWRIPAGSAMFADGFETGDTARWFGAAGL